MSMGQLLASGCAAVFNPGMFLMVCVAIILGTVFGALPGVSATMAVALGLTFTYTMEPIPAIVFLVAIYCSSITGGSITAILFKIPGVPSSAPKRARPSVWRCWPPLSAACSPPSRCSCCLSR